MSEIDKPGNQPPAEGWTSPAGEPAAAVGQPSSSTTPGAGTDDTAVTPAAGAAYAVSASGESTPPTHPASQPAFGSAAYGAGESLPAGQTPTSGAGGGTASQPVSGPAYAAAGVGAGYAAGQAAPTTGAGYGPSGYVVGQTPVSGPHSPTWTPPNAAPKKRVPTAVKAIAGVTAAGVLALCSGITGAVIATAINNGDGINLPMSTDTAPVVNENSVAGVAAKIQPSVVSIATGSGEGSGVILTEDGYILTNNHVVESARGGSVSVTLSNGKKIQGKVVGTDPRTDLAVVKAEATGLTPATLADSGKVNVGDTVLAVGSPLGLQGSVTKGIISAKERTIRAGESGTSLSGLLQTDAPINPGNSGGALVDMNGNVIGINTAIATSGQGEGNIGVGFAIPSSKAKTVAEQLMKGQKVSHPFLGVSVTAEETGGAKISAISPNSPAAEAGLQQGDVITKFGDKVVNDSDDLVSAVQSGTVGQKVTVEYTRNGEQKTATVTLREAS
ncbi:S1C family serine protease [Catelliglobosispora koreensis]|uniref:S1C family serine protease n=1 Tax=Catelliglobosispora koreensis TaxID=129052 RepID=UPI0003695C7C|nr:trypsin-like peptidase domain-containing protein [Catelliglobosispora koreensis]